MCAARLHNPLTRWDDLVNAAVLGLDRLGGETPPNDSPWLLPGALATGEDAVESFLAEAATLAVYEYAGRETTVAAEPLPAACEAETRRCSAAAGRQLLEILHGRRRAMLLQWCAAANAGQWTAPNESTPALLEAAVEELDTVQRCALTAVAGRRGRWLAELNPRWSALFSSSEAASDGGAATTWEDGAFAERVALLRTLRKADRNEAQRLVATTWNVETAVNRAKLLELYAADLHEDDEAWLEQCLDDRSKQVRGIAADLLSRLPASAFSGRMAARAQACVRLSPGGGVLWKKQPKIEAALPDKLDEAMCRDSLEEKAKGGLGAKAAVLSQIVGFAPLAVWRRSEAPPPTWIAAAQASDWKAALLDGWIAACTRQRDATWAGALLEHVCLSAAAGDGAEEPWRLAAIEALTTSLTPEEAERIAIQSLNVVSREVGRARADALLRACNFAWNEALSAAVVEHLQRRAYAAEAVYDYSLRQLMSEAVAMRLDPGMADHLGNALSAPEQGWSGNFADVVAELIDAVRFRRDMLQELA